MAFVPQVRLLRIFLSLQCRFIRSLLHEPSEFAGCDKFKLPSQLLTVPACMSQWDPQCQHGAGAEWRPHLQDLVDQRVARNPRVALPLLDALGSLVEAVGTSSS